ncbi:MAG: precorrin-6A/cobalt-precorrin-6A reductase [Alphaproteobacteria bacterium]
MTKNILILGGTFLARDLLQKIIKNQIDVFCFYSLKNIASHRFLPQFDSPHAGKIIAGGFSQFAEDKDPEQGLKIFCQREHIALLVLAVSPFAYMIAQNVKKTSRDMGLPLLVLKPKNWDWGDAIKNKKIFMVDNLSKLADLFLLHIPRQKNIFLALGKKDGMNFLSLIGEKILQSTDMPKIFWRTIYPPDSLPVAIQTLPIHNILLPPQNYQDEKKFLAENHIGLVIGKNSGGDNTNSKNKIMASLSLGIPSLLLSPPLEKASENTGDIFFSPEGVIENIAKIIRD